MTKIHETPLPGVGVRHDFQTEYGSHVGVITHRGGDRELLIYSDDDPDACQTVMRLSSDDSHALTDLLGGSQVAESVTNLQYSVEGVAIDWVPIGRWACAGHTLQESNVRAKTGVSVVAVVRGQNTFPAPGPDFRLEDGDTAVVVGTPDGIHKAYDILKG